MEATESGNDRDARMASFWQDFQLFPTKAEQIVFGHTWLLVAIALLPFSLRLAISLAADSRGDWMPVTVYLREGKVAEANFAAAPWVWTQDSLDQWILFLVTIGLLPALWAYRRWLQKVPDFFQWLLTGDLIHAGNEAAERRYWQYLHDYRRALASRKGRLLFVVIAVSILVIWHLAAGRPAWLAARSELLAFDCPVFFTPGWCAAFRVQVARDLVPYGLGYLIWCILLAPAAWTLYATGRQVGRLTDYFDVRLRPSHADKCGGLSPVGDFCFDMALPLGLGFIIVVLIALVAALLQAAGGRLALGPVTLQVPWITVVVITLAGLLLLTPLVAVAFFAPLAGVHHFMAARKREAEDAHADKVTALENEARLLIETNRSAALVKEQLETLQVIARSRQDFRAWPFRPGTLLGLFSPQIALTAIGLLRGLKELLGQ